MVERDGGGCDGAGSDGTGRGGHEERLPLNITSSSDRVKVGLIV